MIPLAIEDVTKDWNLVAGRPVKLAVTIDVLKTADAGMAMLLDGRSIGRDVCITRVTIDASVAAHPGGGEAAARPLHTVVEKTTKSVGACAGLTRGIGLVSRDAVIALIGQIGQVGATTAPPRYRRSREGTKL